MIFIIKKGLKMGVVETVIAVLFYIFINVGLYSIENIWCSYVMSIINILMFSILVYGFFKLHKSKKLNKDNLEKVC